MSKPNAFTLYLQLDDIREVSVDLVTRERTDAFNVKSRPVSVEEFLEVAPRLANAFNTSPGAKISARSFLVD